MPMTEKHHLKTTNYLDGHKDHRIKMPFESYTLLYSSVFYPLISLFPLQTHKTDIVKNIFHHSEALQNIAHNACLHYLGSFLKHFLFPTQRGLLALSISMKYKAEREVSTVCKLHSGFPLVPSCPIRILYISPMLLRTTWMECKGEKVTNMFSINHTPIFLILFRMNALCNWYWWLSDSYKASPEACLRNSQVQNEKKKIIL